MSISSPVAMSTDAPHSLPSRRPALGFSSDVMRNSLGFKLDLVAR